MWRKLIAFMLTLALLGAWGASVAETEAAPLRVVALKGPTAMGMVKMMEDNNDSYDFTIAAAIDEVTPLIAQGKTDIAAVPANLAAVLYQKLNGEVQVLAINTLGVLYIVENGDTVHSVEDLRGRTIYASGKGATPEYALQYILSGNGLDPEKDLTIEWKSEHTECLNALLNDEKGIALLPQPFVTTAMTKAEGLRVAIDLNDAWDALQKDAENPSALLTGVVVVRRAFAQEHPDQVNAFLDAYAASVAFVQENNDEAAALVGKYEIIPEAVAKKALPACNIVFIEGEEMARKLSGYLTVLFEANPASVGGQMPDEAFYFKR
ncbi:MAG: ABC transporter substrate-binding protein [Clostridia bacterium]|nr:ABC transporter substrate-binding protein [Clostridia bacterium]